MTDEAVFDYQSFLKNVTERPGVYRMLSGNGEILYVGKAKNLKKRLTSYFRKTGLSAKTQSLVSNIKDVEVTVTHTESEALILECNLIKEHRPRYNILLRDDKSFPYIFLATEHDYPRLSFHRGAKREKGRYFGPYPSSGAARESLKILQKLFPVRQCEDSFYRNRSRPCLQYQIKRCSAPCVGLVSKEEYAEDVSHAVMFLEGKSNEIIDLYAGKMEEAAKSLDYEEAAIYRDHIVNLRKVQERQYVSGEQGNVDIIAADTRSSIACVQVFFIRGGRNLGNKTFYPKVPKDANVEEVLEAFITQYYLHKEIPSEILINLDTKPFAMLQEALSQKAAKKIRISRPSKGERLRWLQMAQSNVRHALQAQLNSRLTMIDRLENLQQLLVLDEVPTHLECFDISHTQGESTVASCVVFDEEGPNKSLYRRFNIKDVTKGDDYAAMLQALERRYTRVKKEEGKIPDVIFIDGGKGQVNKALQVMDELQIQDAVIVGVSKGSDRRVGDEKIIIPHLDKSLQLSPDSPVLHLIQQIRDEAHRFAISGHRGQRAKKRTTSTLEEIEGLGPKRRQMLLNQFGGLQEVARAGVEDLSSVKGISRNLAQRIYDTFHGEENVE